MMRKTKLALSAMKIYFDSYSKPKKVCLGLVFIAFVFVRFMIQLNTADKIDAGFDFFAQSLLLFYFFLFWIALGTLESILDRPNIDSKPPIEDDVKRVM